MLRKIIRLILLAIITVAVVGGCVVAGVYAFNDSGATSGSDAVIDTDTTGDGSASEGGSSSGNESSEDGSSSGSESSDTGSGTLTLGSLNWSTTTDVQSVAYNSTTKSTTSATVSGNAATNVTAAVNLDIYGELAAVDGLFDGAAAEYDITSSFVMQDVFDNLFNYTDDNRDEFSILAESYFSSSTPLITITATDGRESATFGLLVNMDGFSTRYAITYSGYSAIYMSTGNSLTYCTNYVTYSTKEASEGTLVEFNIELKLTGYGSDYITSSGINWSNGVYIDVDVYYTDNEQLNLTVNNNGSTDENEYYYSEITDWDTANGYPTVFYGTYSFTMPAAAVTVFVLPHFETTTGLKAIVEY